MAHSYGPNAPGIEIDRLNSNNPRWLDTCARCGFARINQRHGPPPRTPATVPPEECEFLEPRAARTEKQGEAEA